METHNRYIVWRFAKFEGLDIPDDVLNKIDEMYFSKLVTYRIINVVIGISSIPISLILAFFGWENWFAWIMVTLFTGVNLWQWWWSRYLLYKLRKERDQDGRNLDE